MANTEKSLKRDRTRLRRGQDSHQIDFKKMRKARDVGTEYWRLKRKTGSVSKIEVSVKKDTKKEKAKKEKAKKKEPELEVIDEELDEIYSDDDDIELDDDEDIDEEDSEE